MNYFFKMCSIICCALLFTPCDIIAQCQQFNPAVISNNCNNNNTTDDSTDDFFDIVIDISNGLNPSGTWSSSDGTYTNEPYPVTESANFGPYQIANGDETVTIVDDQFGCTSTLTFEAPETCSNPPISCAYWNNCVELLSSDGCEYTFVISVEGDADFMDTSNPFPVNILNWDFNLEDYGIITSATYLDPDGYYAQNNVLLDFESDKVTLDFFNATNSLDGFELAGDIVIFNVVAEEVPSSFTIERGVSNNIGFIDNNMFTACQDGPDCVPIEIFTEGETISGIIEAYSGAFASCTNTENLGIEGVDISITGTNGNCSAVSENDGTYACTLCEGGPYEICIETTCDEPCGVTTLDLLLMRRVLLLIDDWPPFMTIIGDVNNSNSFSTADLFYMERDLLGINTEFIENWCVFVPTIEITGSNTNDLDLDGCNTIDGPNSPFGASDFVRFMKGDFNGSCTDCVHGDGMGDIQIVSDDQVPGKLDIKVPGTGKIHGIAMKFSIPSGTTFKSINSPLPNFMYNVLGNELHIIWTDPTDENEGYHIYGTSDLFEIEYSGTKPYLLNDENLILQDNGVISNLVARSNPKGREKEATESHTLTIENLTQINLEGASTEATVEVYNISGKLVQRQFIDVANTPVMQLEGSMNLGIYVVRVYNDSNDISKKVLWNKE